MKFTPDLDPELFLKFSFQTLLRRLPILNLAAWKLSFSGDLLILNPPSDEDLTVLFNDGTGD